MQTAAHTNPASFAHTEETTPPILVARQKFTLLVKPVSAGIRSMNLQFDPFHMLGSEVFHLVQCPMPQAAPAQPDAHK